MPVATARLITAKTEHYLCNPHEVIKEMLRLARNQKTVAPLTAIIALEPVPIEINPNYIIMIEYLPEQ